jgi:hypothetical protein
MNKSNGRTILGMALAATLALSTTALTAQTSGGHAGPGHQGGNSGGSSYRGQGNHSGHSSHSRGHSRGHYGGYYGGYVGIGSHSWGYPGYGYYGGYGWYGPPAWGYTSVYPVSGATYGALDLDVSPEGAEIYVDGNLVGVADDFDGYPNFLWLDKGTYDVVIFAPGYQTIARQYSIYGGLVIDVEDCDGPGSRRRCRRIWCRSRLGESGRSGCAGIARTKNEVRAYEKRRRRFQYRSPRRPARRRAARRAIVWMRAARLGSLRLEVEPGDASVYLDGRFLGTGRELARLRSGLIVDPGEHRDRSRASRAGSSEAQTFTVVAGEEASLDIELDEE